jgi:N-acyl homoserine lactone hydrolase
MPRIVPLCLGWMSNDASVMIPGAEGRVRYPVAGYAIVHERGTVMHDTSELDYLANVFAPELTPDDLIQHRLTEAGIDIASVTYLVNSHLHFDHCGQNGPFAHARTVIQQAEWDDAQNPPPMSYVGVPLDEVEAGDIHLIDGAFDVFGDGSVVCVPTPGHTKGHQSLLVSSATEAALLVGDACYFQSMLSNAVTPTYAVDAETQLGSYAILNSYKARGTRLMFSHDVDNWDQVPASLV